MLGSDSMASFACLRCHQLQLNTLNDGYQRNQLKVGKPLIVANLTKNASFRSYGTFAYLLRAHIRNINMCRYIISGRRHELSRRVHTHTLIIIILPGRNAHGLKHHLVSEARILLNCRYVAA